MSSFYTPSWSDALIELTKDELYLFFAHPYGQLPLKSLQHRYGILDGDDVRKGLIIIRDRSSDDIYEYESIEAMIDSGWALD